MTAYGMIRGIASFIINSAVNGQLHFRLNGLMKHRGLLEKKYQADSKTAQAEIRPFNANREVLMCNTSKSASQRNCSTANS
jgi:hypothetical protein